MLDIPNKPVIVTNGADIGYLNDDGNMVQTSGLFGGRLEMAMNDERLMYVSAAEPYILQGIGYENVHGIVMTKDGTAILGSVVETLGGLDLAGVSGVGVLRPESTNLSRDTIESVELDQQGQIRQAETMSNGMNHQTSLSAQSGTIQLPQNCAPEGARDVSDRMSRDSMTSGSNSQQAWESDSALPDQSESMNQAQSLQDSDDWSNEMPVDSQSSTNRPHDPADYSTNSDQSRRIGYESAIQDSESRIDENSNNRVNTDDNWQQWIGPTSQAICIPPRHGS
ncbi:MAG: hypothetical protein FWD57_00135, partial [Polyangiaceae bacterium]|nr:hypothetical protein [Polyangiaceae bacterium]